MGPQRHHAGRRRWKSVLYPLSKKSKNLGLSLSRGLARFVGTWRFVFTYSVAMLTWVLLHIFGVLSIDTLDFPRLNLILCWFAGIQVSILLMDANARADLESRRNVETHKLTKTSARKIDEMYKDISMIEDLLEDLSQETNDEDGA